MPAPTEVEVEVLGPGALDELLDLLDHFDRDEPPVEPDRLRRAWAAMVADRGLTVLGVRDGAGVLVATCVLHVMPNLTRGARPYALVENVVVHRDRRRRGLGTRLLRDAQRRAWAADCYKVMLLTGSRRPEVHRFYREAGFDGEAKHGYVARPDG